MAVNNFKDSKIYMQINFIKMICILKVQTYLQIFPSPTAAPIHANKNDVRLPQVSRFPILKPRKIDFIKYIRVYSGN